MRANCVILVSFVLAIVTTWSVCFPYFFRSCYLWPLLHPRLGRIAPIRAAFAFPKKVAIQILGHLVQPTTRAKVKKTPPALPQSVVFRGRAAAFVWCRSNPFFPLRRGPTRRTQILLHTGFFCRNNRGCLYGSRPPFQFEFPERHCKSFFFKNLN